MKKSRPVLIIGIVTVVAVVGILGLTLVLVPETTSPAFAVATEFMNAAGHGDDASAHALLSDEMQAFTAENCPDASVSACIRSYTPPEWGGFASAVYRRSIPDGRAWDILLVATYEQDQGFSGVCIYHRAEEVTPGDWRITAWSGFVSCDLPNAGLQELRQPNAPNRAP